MYLVGLTGGIAAGKSTLAKRWVEKGAIEIDADQLARQVVAPGTEGLSKIVAEFGSEVLNANGTLNRTLLGKLVFADASKLQKLNDIVHPAVKSLSMKLIDEAADDAIVIYNVPLLVEADVDHDFDFVITVEAPEDQQIQRLIEFRGFTREEALARIRNQAKPIQRANRADVILNSNQDLQLFLKDVDSLWREVQARAKAKQDG